MPSKNFKIKPISLLISLALLDPMAAHASAITNLGTVQKQVKPVRNSTDNYESNVLTDKQKLKSTQSVATVSSKNISLFGPDGSGMQSLSILPNVMISGYNATSASSRSTISMRGVKVGYNSIPGDLETNGITAELDGVPLNSLSQGTGWHSPEVPIGALMSGINVVHGPGNPDIRWYDSLGGTINFIPAQPTKDQSTRVALSGGSFNTQVLSAVHNTGEIDGWSSVLGLAHAQSDSIRKGPDKLRSNTTQVYLKTRKTFVGGSFSAGAYAVNNDEYRPNMIPVDPNPEIHLDGLNGSGPLYSQKTSGFYSTLPKSVWFKHNFVEDYMAWARLRLNLTPSLKAADTFWFRNGNIHHYRVNHFSPAWPAYVENYHERSYNFGDKLIFRKAISKSNELSFGGWWINSRAKSDYLGYAPSLGYEKGNPSAVYFNTTYSTFLAAFVQDTLRLPGSITLTPGVSLNSFQTDFVNNSYSEALKLYSGTLPQDPNFSYDTNPNQSTYFLRTEPSLGLNWLITKDFSAFAHYAIAYQNPTAGNYDNYPIDISALKPIRSTNYDAGVRLVKQQVMGLRQVTASADYFHTLIDHQTIPRTVAGSPITTFGYGSATLQGVDLQFSGRLNYQWSGFANLGWLDSRWNSFYSTTTNTDYNGYPVSNSPDKTFSGGLSYRHFFSNGVLDTTLWDQYIGSSHLWDNLNGAPTRQTKPAYNLLNLSIKDKTTALDSWIPAMKYATVSLNFLNILDKKYNSTEYISSGGYFGTASTGYIIANPGAPSSVYLTLSARF